MIEFKICISANVADVLSNQLMLLGASAITSQDAGNQPIFEPMPGDLRKWDETILTALFEDDSMVHPISDYLTNQKHEFNVQTVGQKDWIRLTQSQSKPLLFGKRLWVCPTWCESPNPHDMTIFLDPGLGFGTGTHPTTALCLEWLAANIAGNETMIDYGCGSGILSIAALKLKASKVIAVDHDPLALQTTQENASKNGLTSNQLLTKLPNELEKEQVDIIVANILANPLIELESRFLQYLKPRGTLILSGILSNDCEAVKAAYCKNFILKPSQKKEEWVRLVMCKN